MSKAATLTIQQWGNSLAVGTRKLSLAQKLAISDAVKHGGRYGA